jgi:hypothetical protein
MNTTRRKYVAYNKNLRFSKYTARSRKARDTKHFAWLDEMVIRFEGKSLSEITVALLKESVVVR